MLTCRLIALGALAWVLVVGHGEAARADQSPKALSPVQRSGVVRALLVGIDRYHAFSHLQGAVADARDLATTLKRAGVADVTLLLDEQVTRAALTAALDRLAQRASANDLVIVTFAGHGSQEKTVVSPAEPDGWDEFFMLAGFDPTGQATTERILDDEMFNWIERVAAKGAQTIFLADVCYAGGLTKAVDSRAKRLGVRGLKRVDRPELAGPNSYFIEAQADHLPPFATIVNSDNATLSIPSLTFLAAVDDKHEAPEIMIDGQPRGAASYILARALEGWADLEGDGDGVTTRHELIRFFRRHVRVISGDRQSPVGEPRTPETGQVGLFRNAGPAAGTVVAAVSPKSSRPPPKVAGLAGAPLGAAKGSDLFWDVRTGDVVSAAGDVVSYAVSKALLPAVVERVSAFQELAHLATGRSLDMAIEPPDKAFSAGERFEATIEGIYGRYLVLLNLAGDGTVQYLFPEGNADNLIDSDRLSIPLRSQAPFGSDTLVAIATKTRRAALQLDLKLLDAQRSPMALVEYLREHLNSDDRITLATYSTRPR